MDPSEDSRPETPPETGRMISGRWIIALMFLFGSVATSGLWIFWYFHTAPFAPLQKAVAVEFPGSAPRVDGGQRRIHKGTPRLLWVVLRVDYEPEQDPVRSQATVDRVVELARTTLDLTGYDQVNVRLFHGELENEIRSQDFETPLHPPSNPPEPAGSTSPPVSAASEDDKG